MRVGGVEGVEKGPTPALPVREGEEDKRGRERMSLPVTGFQDISGWLFHSNRIVLVEARLSVRTAGLVFLLKRDGKSEGIGDAQECGE